MFCRQGYALHILWGVYFGYFVVAGWSVKKTKQEEIRKSRRLHQTLLLLTFSLLFVLCFGPLAWRFLPADDLIYVVGVALAASGLAFGIWARRTLGTNWSAAITIKEDHKLIRTGPYRLVRHPIYTGYLVGLAGSAVAIGEVRGLVAFLVLFIAYYRKSRIEEKWMLEHFGEEYRRYREQVKALVPYLL